MSDKRLLDYIEHMQQAAADALGFVKGLTKDDFLADKRTQQAVVMSILIIGEAATKVMDRYPAFVRDHADVPWQNMRGMRNRIVHGYFSIDLNLVWNTVEMALPALLNQLPVLRQDADKAVIFMTQENIETTPNRPR